MYPIVLPPIFATQFLDYILLRHRSPTTVIICSTRDAFLQELKTSMTWNAYLTETFEDATPVHHLLHPTIHLIATSRSVNLAFTPTLPHLRAYLSTCSTDFDIPLSISNPSKQVKLHKPILAIWGLVALHRSTTEYSAQGLSRTFAGAVEAAQLAGQRLVIAEISRRFDERGGEEVGSGLEPWEEQVPILSSNLRLGGGENGLEGRTIEIRTVAARWCRFIEVEGLEEDA